MNTFSRAVLLALYALAIAIVMAPLPWSIGPVVQRIALITIAIHVLELLLAFKYVKAYTGPLAVSVVLTLLFGLLHWLPIKNRQTAQ